MNKQQVFESIQKRAREIYPHEAPEKAVANLMDGPEGPRMAALYEAAEPGGLTIEKTEQEPELTDAQQLAAEFDQAAEDFAKRHRISKAEAVTRLISTPRFVHFYDQYQAIRKGA